MIRNCVNKNAKVMRLDKFHVKAGRGHNPTAVSVNDESFIKMDSCCAYDVIRFIYTEGNGKVDFSSEADELVNG